MYSYPDEALQSNPLIDVANIGAPIERLSPTPGVDEVVMADDGSRDGTPELVRSNATRLVLSEAGRAACGLEAYLPGLMVSSPRRWENGPLRTLMLCSFVRTAVALCFALRADPRRLASFYKAHDAEKKVDP